MLIEKTLHYKYYIGYGAFYYKELYLTGKWRVVYEPYSNEPRVEVQHRGLLFTKWISEEDINEVYPNTFFTNTCQ